MDCDGQQDPDHGNPDNHPCVMPLQRPLDVVGNAALIGEVFCGPIVLWWVGFHDLFQLVKSYPSPPLSV